MCRATNSPNHAFLATLAEEFAPAGTEWRGLDYGCGTGYFVGFARDRRLDFHGCDTFAGIWESWSDTLDERARPYVHNIEAGRIPFPDNHFDVVTSNQVFEHVPEAALGPVLAEIARVLKPGGSLITFFPTRDVWFEGHLGVYFVHWMPPGSRLRDLYLSTIHRAGGGYYRGDKARDTWVRDVSRILDESVHYHSRATVERHWQRALGSRPVPLDTRFIRHRLGLSPRLAPLAREPMARVLDPVYGFVCRVRAGRVLVTQKVQ